MDKPADPRVFGPYHETDDYGTPTPDGASDMLAALDDIVEARSGGREVRIIFDEMAFLTDRGLVLELMRRGRRPELAHEDPIFSRMRNEQIGPDFS